MKQGQKDKKADLSPEQAREIMLSCCAPIRGAEVLPLQNCLDRVLANDLGARVSHPAQRISAMDGYAVQATRAKNNAVLKIVGVSAAGSDSVPTLGEGLEAVQVFTGATLPERADAVLIDEHTTRIEHSLKHSLEHSLRVHKQPEVGRYIRAKGADFIKGSVCLTEGKLLSLRDIGLAATMNYAWLAVRRKPRLAIVASGDELKYPGEAHESRHISAANSLMLKMLAEACGAEARIVPFAQDSLASLSHAFRDALADSDIVVASGGASRSAADWVGAVVQELRIKELFSRLAMRPGKPTRFGTWASADDDKRGEQDKEIPVLVLPGNPASVYVGGIVFMKPMIEVMLGFSGESALKQAVLNKALPAGGERSHYMRAWESDGGVEIFSDQESAHTGTLARANCLALQPALAPAKKKGESIEVLSMARHRCLL